MIIFLILIYLGSITKFFIRNIFSIRINPNQGFTIGIYRQVSVRNVIVEGIVIIFKPPLFATMRLCTS